MKKYTQPMVEIVSLKSSENIAKTTFSELRTKLIEEKLYQDNNAYTVSQYAITASTPAETVNS